MDVKYIQSPTILSADHHRLPEWAKDLFVFDSMVLQSCWARTVCQCHQLPLSDDKVVLRRTTGLGSRAAAIILLSIFMTPVGNLISTFEIWYDQFIYDTQLCTVIDTTSPIRQATPSTCIDAVSGWHIRNDLLLNSTKIEAIVTGTCQQIPKLDQSHRLTICGVAVPFNSTFRVLWVTLDRELTFDKHITVIVHACNFHLHALCHI